MSLRDNFRAAFSSEDPGDGRDGGGLLPSHDPADERLSDRGGQDISSAIAPGSAVFRKDWFELGDTFHRTLFLEGWPVEVEPNWLRPLYQWQHALDISLYYQPLPLKSWVSRLTDKASKERSELEQAAQQRRSIDNERVQRLEDAEELRNMFQRGESKPVQVSLLVTIRADSKEELDSITRQIEKTLESVSARSRRAELRQKDAFLSVLPFGRNLIADGYSARNMHTQGASFTFPFANADLSHPDGIWYGINRSTNSNIILDRRRFASPHSVILGGTGSGKSVAAKQEVLRALMDFIPVTVVDPDGEFERMCEEVGGQFITIGPASSDRINVLDFSYIADGAEDHLTPKILSVVRLLGTMASPEGGRLHPEAEAALVRLLRQVYADFGYTQDLRTQAQATRERMPVLSDIRAKITAHLAEHAHDPGEQALLRPLAAAMAPYCAGGALGALFDQRTTVDLQSPFVVFNIKPLTAARNDHLLGLGMHTVLEFIWNTTMTRAQQLSGQFRLLFVDEAHVMMRTDESAKFLEDIARRARKCHVGLTVLTQAPEDFLNSARPQGKFIFDQSSMQIVLRLKRKSLQALQDLLGLDDPEVNYLFAAAPGEGMIFAENDRALMSMHTASPQEYDMITTKPEEVAAIEAARRLELDAGETDGIPAEPAAEPARPAPAPAAQPIAPTLGRPEPFSRLGPPQAQPGRVRRTGPPGKPDRPSFRPPGA